MIAAKELRIGNWVLNDNLTPIEIGYEYFIIKSQGDKYSDKYYPILLTPEILDKCGFVDGKSNIFGCCEFIDLDLENDVYNVFIKQDNGEQYDCILMKKQIKYLHELQNIYFALRGEELNYTP